MIKHDLDQTALDELLEWLDRDRDRAGQKYERIRGALIKMFTARGCHCAEELADETLTRVAQKAGTLSTTYEGDPSLFFYGVAKNVHREYLKSTSRESGTDVQEIQDRSQLDSWSSFEDASEGLNETRVNCLLTCLRKLPNDQCDLVVAYYDDQKGKKKESRKSLAQQSQMSANALRLKAHRVRKSLKSCVHKCVERSIRHESPSIVICI